MEPLIIAPPDRKQQWAERAKEIMATFPSIELLNWDKVFELDPVIAGRIINDIIKIGGPSTGRPGKRASLTEQEASSRYRQIIGEDFSYSPFQDAFKDLCGKRSLSTVANLTGLDRNAVYRLIKGKEPSVDQMEEIAKGFKKSPSYFLEYRVMFVTAFVYEHLMGFPESSVVFYNKLIGE